MKIMKLSSLLLLFLTTYSMAMDRPADVQAKIDEVKNKYQLRQFPANKIPASCLSQKIHDQDPNVGLACFIAGYQVAYITSTGNIGLFDTTLKELFPHLNVKQIIIQNDSIFYTPQGHRNALLLAKLKLNDALARLYAANAPVLHDNRYLIRSLLGYREPDINNSYITQSFNDWYNTTFSGKPLDSLKKQQAFNDYEKNMWTTTNDYSTYLQDQVNAKEWLKEQSNKSIEHLEQEIISLKDQLHKKTNIIQRLKTWLGVTTSESSSEFTWTQWWK